MARTMKNEGQLGSGDCWWLVLWVWFLSLTSHTLHSSASGVSLSRRECSLIRSPVPRDANAYTAANEQTKEYTASVEGCTSAMLHQMFVTVPPLSIATEGGINSESDDIDDNVAGNDDDTSITVQDETDTTTLPPSIPWWFQTLLRDLPKNGAYGWWQTLTTANPPLQFCSIAKNGSTEWHEVFCRLNGSEKIFKENGIKNDDECLLNCDNFQAPEGTLPFNVPRVVFIRDPLERLLSSYLNKCQDESRRNEEGHCEPNIIFRDRQMNHREGNDAIEPLLEDIEDNNKQLFAAYLDIMPLKWNLHVTPQAFACDLYRNIHQYNFVGKMDSQFMMDIDRMASHFGGGELAVALNKAFDYQLLVQKDGSKHVNFGTHSADGTRAPKKVNKFYTAQTVRKALEYVSIDYVLLGLSVPSWAKQMLREDYM
eukprot:scaffold114_cov200-Alexandrium_tamarense.AAC.71